LQVFENDRQTVTFLEFLQRAAKIDAARRTRYLKWITEYDRRVDSEQKSRSRQIYQFKKSLIRDHPKEDADEAECAIKLFWYFCDSTSRKKLELLPIATPGAHRRGRTDEESPAASAYVLAD
jgi:hypothetical protein